MSDQRNAADEKEVRRAQQREKFSADNEVQDLKNVLSTPSGRRVIWKLLGDCGVFKLSFNNSGSITAFNEGRRSIGNEMMATIVDELPETFLQMMQEAKGTK